MVAQSGGVLRLLCADRSERRCGNSRRRLPGWNHRRLPAWTHWKLSDRCRQANGRDQSRLAPFQRCRRPCTTWPLMFSSMWSARLINAPLYTRIHARWSNRVLKWDMKQARCQCLGTRSNRVNEQPAVILRPVAVLYLHRKERPRSPFQRPLGYYNSRLEQR